MGPVSAMRVKTRAQERESLRQRSANARAARQGKPLPYPGLFDSVDPTKVLPGASAEEIAASYRAFCLICRPPKRIRHTI